MSEVLTEVRDGVLIVTLNRPEAKNACTGDMWVAIGATFSALWLREERDLAVTKGLAEVASGRPWRSGDKYPLR